MCSVSVVGCTQTFFIVVRRPAYHALMLSRLALSLSFAALCLAFAKAQQSEPRASTTPAPPAPWRALDRQLPPGIAAFELVQPAPEPLHAFLVIVPLDREGIAVRPLRSTTPTAKEPLTELCKRDGARVAVNAHYFAMEETVCRVVGWFVLDGEVLSAPLEARPRAALWWQGAGAPRIGWVGRQTDRVLEWLDVGGTARETRAPEGVRHAIGAGPMLIKDGALRVTRQEERLFAKEDVRHPRTAAALATSLGHASGGRVHDLLLLLVVDGRSDASRGVTLAELAKLLLALGAREALNLDGGGSSTLVIDGQLVNRPTGGTFQRHVPSGIGVFVEKR
jgi:exopolysaccharide biosynthesis protein